MTVGSRGDVQPFIALGKPVVNARAVGQNTFLLSRNADADQLLEEFVCWPHTAAAHTHTTGDFFEEFALSAC